MHNLFCGNGLEIWVHHVPLWLWLVLAAVLSCNGLSVLEHTGASKGRKVEMDGKRCWMEIGCVTRARAAAHTNPSVAVWGSLVVVHTNVRSTHTRGPSGYLLARHPGAGGL